RPQSFFVQPRVDLVRAARAGQLEKPVVLLPAAESARPVPGRERRGLVEEEQLREPPRLKERMPVPAAELQPARDPALPGVPPPDAPACVVEAAAVPVDEAAAWVRDEVAERRHSILERHRVSGR